MNVYSILQEAKDHIIKKLPNLKDKESIIKFFQENPAAEAKLDWNKKQYLTDEYFENFIKEYNRNNKTQLKKNAKKGLIPSMFQEGKDYYDLSDPEENYYLFMPLEYEFQKYIQNLGGEDVAATWCIGWQKSDRYWEKYKRDEDHFIIAISKDLKNKLAYQISFDNQTTIWSLKDKEFNEKTKYCLDTFFINKDGKKLDYDETYDEYRYSEDLHKEYNTFIKYLGSLENGAYKADDETCDEDGYPRASDIDFAQEVSIWDAWDKAQERLEIDTSTKLKQYKERLQELIDNDKFYKYSTEYVGTIQNYSLLMDISSETKELLESYNEEYRKIYYIEDLVYKILNINFPKEFRLPETLNGNKLGAIEDVRIFGCEHLIIPSSYEWINELAFLRNRVKTITFEGEELFRYIDSSAFRGCHALETIYLPKNIKFLVDTVFNRNYKLQKIYISKNTKFEKPEKATYEVIYYEDQP